MLLEVNSVSTLLQLFNLKTYFHVHISICIYPLYYFIMCILYSQLFNIGDIPYIFEAKKYCVNSINFLFT